MAVLSSFERLAQAEIRKAIRATAEDFKRSLLSPHQSMRRCRACLHQHSLLIEQLKILDRRRVKPGSGK